MNFELKMAKLTDALRYLRVQVVVVVVVVVFSVSHKKNSSMFMIQNSPMSQ